MAKYYHAENVLDAVSVDCVIFGFENKALKLLLINRQIESVKGVWALPGGYVRKDEALVSAPRRILADMAHVEDVFLEQIGAFGAIDRFPIQRTITVAYYALINPEHYETYSVRKDALEARWFDVNDFPDLPYDHNEIVVSALETLKVKVRREPIGLALLPDKFSLRQMQNLYEAILNTQLDNRNFRRKILNLDFLKKLKETQADVSHRKAVLYQFDQGKYNQLLKKGINFEI